MKNQLTSSQRTALRGLFFALALVGIVVWACFVSGCQFPQWRVFQKKVDGKEGEKPAAQVEGEKAAAAYIVKRSEPPMTETIVELKTALGDVHLVATGLSSSLGQPAKAVTLADKDAVIATLAAGLKAKDAQLDKWREFGRKYSGQPLEDTGINLAGPAGLVGLVAVVAACVFIPGVGYMLLRFLPVLWGMIRRMMTGIEEFSQAAPGAAEQLKKTFLNRTMDEVDKGIVERRKPKILRATGFTPSPFPAQ